MFNEPIPVQSQPAEEPLEREDIDIGDGMMFSNSGVYSQYHIFDFLQTKN